MDRPPFDPMKAAFYLVAAILAFQCFIVLLGVGICIYWSGEIVSGKYSCAPATERLASLMTDALAAALAFAGGYSRKP